MNEQGHRRILCSLRENNDKKVKREVSPRLKHKELLSDLKGHNLSCVIEMEGEGITKMITDGQDMQHIHNETYEHRERETENTQKEYQVYVILQKQKDTHNHVKKKEKKKRHTHSQTLHVHLRARAHTHTHTHTHTKSITMKLLMGGPCVGTLTAVVH